MRISAIIAVLLCSIGCSTTSDMQCDEFYAIDYNCVISQRNAYLPYNSYYPNIQRVYYTPQYLPNHCPKPPHQDHIVTPSRERVVTSQPRPVIVRSTKDNR